MVLKSLENRNANEVFKIGIFSLSLTVTQICNEGTHEMKIDVYIKWTNNTMTAKVNKPLIEDQSVTVCKNPTELLNHMHHLKSARYA